MHSLIDKILFHDEHVYDKIQYLPYFNNFCKILFKQYPPSKLPSHIKSLTMTSDEWEYHITDLFFPEGLEFIDMGDTQLGSEFPKFPTTLKYLKLPIAYRYMERISPFSDCVNLETVRMNSHLCHLFGKSLPKKTTTLILTGMRFIEKGDIPDHVKNLHIEALLGDVGAENIPLNIQRLKLCDHAEMDFGLFVRRNMTLIVNQHHRESIEKLEWGPDFRVEYFD